MGKQKPKPGYTPDDIVSNDRRLALIEQIEEDPASRSMTDKQKALAVEMLAFPEKSPKQQALDAGYAASSNAALMMRQIKGKLRKTFEAAGVFEHHIGQLILDGISAMKIKHHILKRTLKNGTVEEYIATTSEKDLGMRHKYGETLIRLGNYNPATKLDINSRREIEETKNLNISVTLEKVPQEALEASVMEDQRKRVEAAKKAEFEVIEENKRSRGKQEIREAV